MHSTCRGPTQSSCRRAGNSECAPPRMESADRKPRGPRCEEKGKAVRAGSRIMLWSAGWELLFCRSWGLLRLVVRVRVPGTVECKAAEATQTRAARLQ